MIGAPLWLVKSFRQGMFEAAPVMLPSVATVVPIVPAVSLLISLFTENPSAL